MTVRALYLAPDPALRLDQPGGAGTHIRGTLAGLRAAGIEVEAWIGNPASPTGGRATIAQIAMPLAARRAPRVVREFARDLRLLAHARSFKAAKVVGYDCVYERSAYLVDAGRLLAARADIPYLVETDGIRVAATKAAYGGVLLRRAEQIERRKLAAAAAVVVTSEASARQIGQRHDIPIERLLVKGLGVEEELFAMSVPDAMTDIGFAGTFQPYHGVDLLAAALELRPELTALLLGDGPAWSSVAARFAHQGGVELSGLLPRQETLRRLAACRALVVPDSDDAVYPVKLLEYAALGRPVVCPDLPAFDEFEREGPALFRFPARDPVGLLDALGDALADEDGRAARLQRLVRERYTWNAVGARLAERMRRLVEA